jgi:hypothetical protein
MAVTWEDRKSDYPEATEIIDAGLEKLDVYRQRAELVPAYVLAMSKWLLCSVLNV